MDLLLRGHRVGAGQAGRDDRARRGGEADGSLQGPVGEQAVTQRAAEGIPRPEAVDHLDGRGWDLDRLLAAAGEDAARAALDDLEAQGCVPRGLPFDLVADGEV